MQAVSCDVVQKLDTWLVCCTHSLKRTLHSRGYLNLLTPADVLAFKERFDGHVFVSSKGSQYRCSVEYAPFQRVPKPAAKKPAVEGTIESGGADWEQHPHHLL